MLESGLNAESTALYPLELFNLQPQSVRLGSTSHGACIFAPNVVPYGTEASQPGLSLTAQAPASSGEGS